MPEKTPRILCLDDEIENLNVSRSLLEAFGCEVAAVTDAEDCLRAARESSFDLAILDYHLRGETTGEWVAHELRALAPGLKLMMLSSDPDLPQSAKDCVDAVFLKGSETPFSLLNAIQSLLPGRDLKSRRKPVNRAQWVDADRKTASND